MNILIVVGAIIAVFAISQFIAVAWEHSRRWKRYHAARSYADSIGKPLLVVGRPSGMIRLYKEGDVTLDLDPKVAEECKSGCVADIRRIPFPDGHFASAFVSHVLEYLPDVTDMDLALKELRRVAEKVYVCYTLPLTIWWRFFSIYHRLWIHEDKSGKLIAQRRPW